MFWLASSGAASELILLTVDGECASVHEQSYGSTDGPVHLHQEPQFG